MRSDYSFSDYGIGPSFYSMTLAMAPFTSKVLVSKQIIKETAIEPLSKVFAFVSAQEYLAGGRMLTTHTIHLLLANEQRMLRNQPTESDVEQRTHTVS